MTDTEPIALTEREMDYLTEDRLDTEHVTGEFDLEIEDKIVGKARYPRTIKAACNPALRVTCCEFTPNNGYRVNDGAGEFVPTHAFIIQDLGAGTVNIQFGTVNSVNTPEAEP